MGSAICLAIIACAFVVLARHTTYGPTLRNNGTVNGPGGQTTLYTYRNGIQTDQTGFIALLVMIAGIVVFRLFFW